MSTTGPGARQGHLVTGIDLHAHTTASDGLMSPTALITEARARGIAVLGVTDHDTLDGLAEAEATAEAVGIVVVPGVELSTTIPGPEIHVLGYYVNRHDPVFTGRLTTLARDRVRRIERVVSQLNEAGYPVEIDGILAQADHGTVGRPHVARALVALGAAADVNDAFARFLKRGTVGWAPRSPFTAEDAIQYLLDNGAVPVLAHPLSTGDAEGTAARLAAAGLRGFEVFYGQYAPDQQQHLLDIARRYDLLPTGGSDFHGPNYREGRDLGTVEMPAWVWDGLRAAVGRLDG
jgi:predicted metal-dependent phosphoesterase TrpH